MNVDMSVILPQLGISVIFVYASYKLYTDAREDSKGREEQMRQDSKEREEKLVVHLDKVVNTLENINDRLCTVERCVVKEGEVK